MNRSSSFGLLAMCLAACGGDPMAPELLVSFVVERFDPSMGALPGDTAEGGAGTITVSGGISIPCLGEASEISAIAEQEGKLLFLQLRWVPTGQCVPGVDAFTYVGTLGNLDPDTYELTVSQVFPDLSGFVTLATQVVVR